MLTRRSPRRTYRPIGPTSDVVDAVLERASRGGVPHCEVCGWTVYGERGREWALHHRKGRGLPDSHLPQNLIFVHGSGNVEACHGRIHQNRGEAQEMGWSISRNSYLDPLNVAVLVVDRWVYLTSAGEYADEPPGGAA